MPHITHHGKHHIQASEWIIDGKKQWEATATECAIKGYGATADEAINNLKEAIDVFVAKKAP